MNIHVHVTGILDDEVRSFSDTVQVNPKMKREEAAAAIKKLMIDNNIEMRQLCHSGWFELPSDEI
jgi:hypothetical protein